MLRNGRIEIDKILFAGKDLQFLSQKEEAKQNHHGLPCARVHNTAC